MKKDFFLLFIIHLLIFLCNCQTNIPGDFNYYLTILETSSQGDGTFSAYPSVSNQKICTFNHNALVQHRVIDGKINTLVSASNEITIVPGYSSGDCKLFSLTVTLYAGTSINLNLIANSEANFTINYTCNEVKISDIEVIILRPLVVFENQMFFSSFLLKGMGGHIFEKLELVQADSGVMFTNTGVGRQADSGVIFSNTGVGGYLFIWNVLYIIDNINNPYWNITIDFGNDNKTISFQSFYSNYSFEELPQQLNEPKFYPENYNTQIYSQFGFGVNQFLTTNFKSEVFPPFQFGLQSYSYPKPIKGSKSEMVFGLEFEGSTDLSLPLTNILWNQNKTSLINSTFYSVCNEFPVPSWPEDSRIFFQGEEQFKIIVENLKYEFFEFELDFNGKSFIRGFPYGFYRGSNNNQTLGYSFNNPLFLSNPLFNLKIFNFNSQITFPFDPITTICKSNNTPSIIGYNFIQINSITYLLTLEIKSDNGIYSIIVNEETFGLESISSGNSSMGTFEIIFKIMTPPNSLKVFDSCGLFLSLNHGDIISMYPLFQYKVPDNIIQEYSFDTFNITFEKNDIKLLNKTGYNILYIDGNNISPDLTLGVLLFDTVSFSIYNQNFADNVVPCEYDFIEKRFECRLIIPKNNIYDYIRYVIVFGASNRIFYSGNLPISSTLRVNDTYLDNDGPIFSLIEIIGDVDIISGSRKVGWNFTITDDLNGFDKGYIKVMGSLDSSTYEFNFTSFDFIEGDEWNGVYSLLINVSSPCCSQTLTITNVILYDRNNLVSKFSLFPKRFDIPDSISNPFRNYYKSGLNITKIDIACDIELSPQNDSNPVILSTFNISTKSLNVIGSNRDVTIDFSVLPSTSGLKLDQLPVVYIHANPNSLIDCKSELKSNNQTLVVYSCTIEIPLGFGYPGNLLFSIYGFINNAGFYNGFLSEDIKLIGAPYYINTTLLFDEPIITSTSKVYSDTTQFQIFGRGLSSSNKVKIYYSQYNLSIAPVLIYDSTVTINIKPSKDPFKIQVEIINYKSNIFTVYPIYFDLNDNDTNPTQSPTQSLNPTQSPTQSLNPTQSPTPTQSQSNLCKGNPQCGGKNQGECSLNGCICFSPWMGPSCNSQIIIVPPPTINTTSPSTEIPIPNNSTDSSILYSTLISIVSLRELNFNGDQEKIFYFEKWIYSKINNFKSIYFTTIPSENSNITVTLEWFNSSSIIKFANETITMNPSSIKYTIEIDGYQFLNKLNSLQLVLSASLETNKEDVCSSKEFGSTDTTTDYLKIQIEDHSLYGRFIKRGIVDGKPTTISNQLLDKFFNTINEHSSVQSFIGITIPYFKNIIIDPDFSVLLDYSKDSNSNCYSNSKLSASQIAGIIIGCVLFLTIIIISIIYYIIKKRKQKNFIKNIGGKLQKIN
ncbi:hypothetical protein ACTFIZ_000305 [Dictyostelium cf. discoideum]